MVYLQRLNASFILAVAIYCGVIFFLSSQEDLPTDDLLSRVPGADKAAHAVLYGGLAALLSFGLRQSNEFVPFPIQFFGPIVFAALYGVSDEIHQRYVPTRMLDPLDVVADIAGALAIQLFLCFSLWKAGPVDGESSP